MLKVYLFGIFLTLVLRYLDYSLVCGGLFLLALVMASLYPIGDWGSFSMFWVVDTMSYILLLLTIFIVVLGLLSSYDLVKGSKGVKVFISLVLILLNLLIFRFRVNDLLLFYVFFEASLIPLTVVVIGYGNQPEKVEAGLYILFYTIFGSLPLLIGLMAMGSERGSLGFGYLVYSSYTLSLLYFPLVSLAFLIKLPVYLVHLWLPKAHVEAPVFGSIILAGIMLKLGGYGLIRFLPFFVDVIAPRLDLVLRFSLVGGVLARLICLSQGDLKSLVAYSSVGHIMMFLGGLFSLSCYGGMGGLVLMIAHGLTSSGLFSLINMMYERVHSRSILLIRGVLLVSPLISIFWFILSASNMAAPPFLNLVGELYLSFGVLGVDSLYGLPLGLMFFVGGAYSMYFFSLTQHGALWGSNSFYAQVNPRESFILLAHIFPLVALVLKMDLLF